MVAAVDSCTNVLVLHIAESQPQQLCAWGAGVSQAVMSETGLLLLLLLLLLYVQAAVQFPLCL
jgi:hypothetical protein